MTDKTSAHFEITDGETKQSRNLWKEDGEPPIEQITTEDRTKRT